MDGQPRRQYWAGTIRALLFFSIAGAAVLGVSDAVQATDYASTNFIIRDPIMSVHGGRGTSSNFEIYSSTGQTVIGESNSTNFIIRSGFLYYPAESSSSGSSGGESGGSSGGNRGGAGPTISPTPTVPPGEEAPPEEVTSTPQAPGIPEEVPPGETLPDEELSVPPEITEAELKIQSDFDHDGKIGVFEFSVLLYWYYRPSPNIVLERIDLSGDGKITLTDFSILAYFWKP